MLAYKLEKWQWRNLRQYILPKKDNFIIIFINKNGNRKFGFKSPLLNG